MMTLMNVMQDIADFKTKNNDPNQRNRKATGRDGVQ
jgi:hypothetical protein